MRRDKRRRTARLDGERDVIDLGYESAHTVLPDTVKKGSEVEHMLNSILKEIGYVDGRDYQKQKNVTYSSVSKYASITEDVVIPNEFNPETIISAVMLQSFSDKTTLPKC